MGDAAHTDEYHAWSDREAALVLKIGDESWHDDSRKRALFGATWDDWTLGLGISGARRIRADRTYPEGAPWWLLVRVGPFCMTINGRQEAGRG